MAALQVKEPLLEKEGHVKGGCPTDIGWVTWGIAKTDPWGNVFLIKCTPPAAPVIGSAGPDGKPNTADDLWSDAPVVDAGITCSAACKRARTCNADVKTVEALCATGCGKLDYASTFFVDSCTQLKSCLHAAACYPLALTGHDGSVPCDEFGRVAATAMKKPAQAKALQAECERDRFRAGELPCVAASTTATEAALCSLTVNRANIEDLLH
jgi:hypothetical protein